MKRLPSGVARTVFIAGLAGGIFAAFLLLTPKLAATGLDSVVDLAPTTAVPATVTSTTTTTTTTRVAPTTPLTTVPTTTITAAEVPATVDREPMTPANGYDGTVRLTVHLDASLDGTGTPVLTDLETVMWRFHVTNTTDQELWGVFVWLERGGRAGCDHHRLPPFGETDCWLATTVYSDDTTAEAWVDAWTTTRQVHDRVFFPYRVGAA